MKVGLIDIEPKIVNTAYMQISQYHKEQGNTVEWWTPLTDRQFDKVYCSSLFTFTDKREVPKRAICGGTGYNLIDALPPEIEACDYDYSIYPDCDYSIVWFSRGCIRQCPFCIVSQKEGKIKQVAPKNLNDKGRYIVVQDNNFFANQNWKNAINTLIGWREPVDFQGIDIRTITVKRAAWLNCVKLHKQLKIAWDNPKDDIGEQLHKLTKFVSHYKIMCYVLIGYWSTPEEDLYRVNTLRNFGIDPFVMPYNKKDPYQKRFARWVNHKAIFKTVKWEDYKC
jgi:hypothetical protein